MMVSHVLREQGYTVLQATNGLEALSVAKEYSEPIHLLMTDIVMPLMGGRELAEKIKETHSQIRVLFTSGYNDDNMLHQITAEDATLFMEKPFTPVILAGKVRDVLDR